MKQQPPSSVFSMYFFGVGLASRKHQLVVGGSRKRFFRTEGRLL